MEIALGRISDEASLLPAILLSKSSVCDSQRYADDFQVDPLSPSRAVIFEGDSIIPRMVFSLRRLQNVLHGQQEIRLQNDLQVVQKIKYFEESLRHRGRTRYQ
jgi:hypothetical protein